MNVNKLIIDTLTPTGYVPNFGTYKGTLSTYITFNYADDRAVSYADDEPQIDVASVQIHLFIPRTIPYSTLKKQIRSKLFKAGFTYPVITILEENDTEKFHIIFECEIEGNTESEVI